jgi:hypothetical protein
MRLSIIPSDGAVYVDGAAHLDLDLSSCGIPSNVHALQWYDTYGELEFKRSFVDGQIIHPMNEVITELPAWASLSKSVWDDAKLAKEEAAQQAAEAARLLAEQQALANSTAQSEQG